MGNGRGAMGRGGRFWLPETGGQRREKQRHETEGPKHALYVIGQAWEVKIIRWSRPALRPLERMDLGGQVQPRSCRVESLEGKTSKAQHPTPNILCRR